MRYAKLLLMAFLSFVCMYLLMYMMVDRFSNVYSNLNQLYMAALMTAPMVLIELLLMRSMYTRRRLNICIGTIALGIGILAAFFIRKQIAITDKEFLRSMIPHHGAAILMCQKARVHDPALKELCKSIIAAQESEIVEMKARLAALEK